MTLAHDGGVAEVGGTQVPFLQLPPFPQPRPSCTGPERTQVPLTQFPGNWQTPRGGHVTEAHKSALPGLADGLDDVSLLVTG